MRGITCLLFVSILLGACCAPQKPQKQARGQERRLQPESALLDEKYQLFSVMGMEMPIADNTYLLAKDGETDIEIRKAAEFAQIVKGVTSPEDALNFVRLLTSQQFRLFIADVNYTEVHKKDEADAEDRWFAIEPQQYEDWKLHDPVVSEEDGQYKIERFVARYPYFQDQQRIPAQLLKIREWVATDGTYSMEVQEVVAEGDAIGKILLLTK